MEKIVLTKKHIQIIEIIEMLMSIPRDVTVEMISNHLRVTRKKAEDYVHSLNFLFKEHAIDARINLDDENLTLNRGADFSINKVKQIFCEKSDEFIILKRMLFCSSVKINELADELFVSRATVTRKIKNLKEKLEQYGIGIENRPLKLVGDEYNIILFYSILFGSIYGKEVWPFDEIVSLKDIKRLSSLFSETLSVQIIQKETSQLYYQLAVFYIRMKNRGAMGRQYISHSKVYQLDVTIMMNDNSFSKITPLKQFLYSIQLNKKNEKMMEKDLKMYLCIFFQNTVVKNINEYTQFKKKFFGISTHDIYGTATKIIEIHRQQHFITVVNECYVIEEVVNGLIELFYWNEALIKKKYEIITKEEENKLNYQLIEMKLANSIDEAGDYLLNDNILNNVLLSILSHVLMPYINSKYEGWYINVRVISEAGEGYEKKIGELLKKKYRIKAMTSTCVNEKSDLIITDTGIASSNKEILPIEFPMSELDFEKVDEKIHNIHKNKIRREKKMFRIEMEKDRSVAKKGVFNERGSTLVEVMCAVLLFSFIFIGGATMLVQNQEAIHLTTQKAKAEEVKMDVKEWLNQVGMRNDVGALNWICFNGAESSNEETKKRSQYFLLDDTGITYDSSGESIYGEFEFETYMITGQIGVIKPKTPSRRVTYDDVTLPASLYDKSGSIGYYRLDTDYLVGCEVLSIDNTIKKALNLELSVYDSKTGKKMATSNFKFIYSNDNTENPYQIQDEVGVNNG